MCNTTKKRTHIVGLATQVRSQPAPASFRAVLGQFFFNQQLNSSVATVDSQLNQDIVRLFKSGTRPNSWTILRCYQWTTNRWAMEVYSDSAVFQGRFALAHELSALQTTLKPRKKSKEFLIGAVNRLLLSRADFLFSTR